MNESGKENSFHGVRFGGEESEVGGIGEEGAQHATQRDGENRALILGSQGRE